jgi:hypothetical protein
MPAQRPPTPAQQQKPVELGDFTKMFSAPTKPPGPGPAPSGGGDYTDSLYGKQSDRGGSGMPPSSAGGSAPPPSPGGSEYTRALKRVSFSEMEAAKGAKPADAGPTKGGDKKGAAPAETAAGDDEEKKPNFLPIILIVVGLIVVLVIVVVLSSSLSGL